PPVLPAGIAAAPASPAPARRSHAPNRSLRNTRSAAAGSTPPAPSWDAPASPHRTAGTAPPRTRRSGIPPAVGSSADRTDDSRLSPAKPAESTSLLVALDPSVFPSPCAHSTRICSSCIPSGRRNLFTRIDFHHGLLGHREEAQIAGRESVVRPTPR